MLELVHLTREKNFKAHPQNRILVPVKGSFESFWQVLFFYMGVPPLGRVQNSSRLPATAGTLVTLAGDFSQKQ